MQLGLRLRRSAILPDVDFFMRIGGLCVVRSYFLLPQHVMEICIAYFDEVYCSPKTIAEARFDR